LANPKNKNQRKTKKKSSQTDKIKIIKRVKNNKISEQREEENILIKRLGRLCRIKGRILKIEDHMQMESDLKLFFTIHLF